MSMEEIVDRILANRRAHPEHDIACLLCGETYFEAQGHACSAKPPETRLDVALAVLRSHDMLEEADELERRAK